MRQRTGYVFKKGKVWVARITYTDSEGKRKNLTRNAQTKTEARELLDDMRTKLKDYGAKPLDGERMKMSELVNAYTKAKIIPAEYHGDRKVAGMRSHQAAKLYAEVIKEYFDKKRVKDVTPTDIEAFKTARLKTPTKSEGQRSITSVNRELELLRAIFAYAKREGLILFSPFERLRGVISKADERRRDRVLSYDEEKRLLDACDGPRAHLRPILICALDTAMRRGEILKLRWRDVDLDTRTITVTALNSKTARERTVGMTTRLHAELARLREMAPDDPDVLVFGITDNFKNAFASACRDAQIEDFRFHDCRHTCVTRWVRAGLPIAEIMRLSGHSTLQAFAIYANSTSETVRRGADALDALRADVENVENVAQASDLIN